MSSSTTFHLLLIGVGILILSTPVSAFGAGNIINVSEVAGKNWRHGDIEDTLLGLFMSAAGQKKFDKLAVKRVYFGNWLRDYSQAIDVGGLKQLPKDTIRTMLWILSFVTFGFATGEFEVTEERLGCYRPEEHIDNPRDYADNEDARKYDSRLRGPCDEKKEIRVDPRNAMKNYIASEDLGIDTSAGFVRNKFNDAIEKGRAYGRDGRKEDLYEALRLLGTGLHCLEDFAAHSNYIELALRELEVDAYPHTGARTEVTTPDGKKLWPIVTGTFGMTDFLHSVIGEFSDKMAQSEVQELDNKLSDATNKSKNDNATSTLKGILDKVPWTLLGLGGNNFGSQAQKLQDDADAKEVEQKANIGDKPTRIGGVDTEQIKKQAQDTMKEIYPILEFHDKLMKAISSAIDKIPGLSDVIENLTGALQIFIFSILAPYVKPILSRTKIELAAGSTGVLSASAKGQYLVFENELCSDPTHSMLSKDHFTNVLNEPAGRVASAIVSFAVPLIVSAWDDDSKDPRAIVDEILQVLHHPALRDSNKDGQQKMFGVVQQWWEEKDQERQSHIAQMLSKDGVKEGKNHEGHDPNPGPGGCTHSHGSLGAGSSGQNQGRQDSGRDQDQGDSYGSSRRDENTSSSYGRDEDRQGGDSYGSSSHRGDNQGYSGREQSSSYGRGNESSSYGRGNNDQSYGRQGRDESSSYGGGGGRSNEQSYGSDNRREDDNNFSYGRNTESSSYGRGDGGNTSSHGQGRNEDRQSGYGSSRNQTSSYGDETSYSSRNEETSYEQQGGSRSRDDGEGYSYGSSRRNQGSSDGREDEQGSGYGRQEVNDRSQGYGGY